MRKISLILILSLILLFVSAGLWGYLALTSDRANVTVSWKTASELNTAGFNVYRGESPDKVVLRLNQTTIPPAIDSLRGAEYKYVDRKAKPGIGYYYKIEEIELSGESNFYGPIEHTAKGAGKTEYAVAFFLVGAGLAGILFCVITWRRS
jgi:hypothetical protein